MELTNELIAKVKSCKSVEDIKSLGEEIGNPVTLEEAEVYYKQYCGEQGEIDLDELDNTNGGGCTTKVDGVKYTVVSSGTSCFTSCYDRYSYSTAKNGNITYNLSGFDNQSLRKTWTVFSANNKCGTCKNLQFNGSTGYCSKS